MTYDLAVWEGDLPADNAAASTECGRLSGKYLDVDYFPPTAKIKAFVADLNARWPDLDDLHQDDVDESPWADSPLIGNAVGPFLYFAMMYSKAEDVAVYAAERAKAHGLVCFDINQDRLRR